MWDGTNSLGREQAQHTMTKGFWDAVVIFNNLSYYSCEYLPLKTAPQNDYS